MLRGFVLIDTSDLPRLPGEYRLSLYLNGVGTPSGSQTWRTTVR